MPVVPPATITDLPKSERAKAIKLMYERSLMQYYFSYEKLIKLLRELGDTYNDEETLNQRLCDCICAFTEDQAKEIKSELNDKITTIFTNNGIDRTLRYFDPFQRNKDYIMMEGVATSFSQSRALPLMVAGVFEWCCTVCNTVNFTVNDKNVFCSNAKCKHFHHADVDLKDKSKKLKLMPIEQVRAKKVHRLAAEAVIAAFAAATNQTRYVTLQARDVKEENGGRKG